MSSSGVNLEKYRIPLDEILRITSNFSSKTLIGDGGFGKVYIGELSKDGQKRTVAIKRLDKDGYQGNNEFRNELDMVSSFNHPNIITFIGYCDEANEKIIISEYARNESLDHHLQKPDKIRGLTWAQRLKICLGAAKGLKYLHSGLGEDKRVIHRDVKSANILLDENLEAKICDFGLSKFGARNQEDTQVHTKVAGTRYYMDPLYFERSRLTKESDVYSFGVVMFEMSSGTLVYHPKCFGNDAKPQFLIDVVRSCYDDDKKAAGPGMFIDPMIRTSIDMKSFQTFNEIAHECISMNLKERPTMARIIRKIQQALNIIQSNDHESPSTITTRSLESFLIPLEKINLATKNFNHETCIGDYDYGVVHRGQLSGQWQNHTMAITRFYPKSYQSENEFYKELRIISGIHHQNISPFMGYCDESNERIIVHEHAVNGSLADYIGNSNSKPYLRWAQRLKICIGAARGLQYLHLALGEDNQATRGNINCRNILIDETLDAKISFFGLSKQGPTDRKPHDYISGLQKSDMYSFGVIMFEMLSGRRAYELLSLKLHAWHQIDVLQEYYHNNELDQFIARGMRNEIDSRCLNIFKEIAYRCIMRDNQKPRTDRDITYRRDPPPRANFNMADVVERLQDAGDFQGVEV